VTKGPREPGMNDPERTIPDGGPRFDLERTVASPDPAGAATQTSAGSEDPTIEPPTRARPAGAPAAHVGPFGPQPSRMEELREIGKDLLKKHEKKIWWLHTAYALGLGAFVATFAQKGFERARLLTLSLTAAWLLVVFFFRFFGTGAQQDFMTAWPGMRRRFFVMSYLMKNLFQGMLFYLLPFYWKSTSVPAKTTLPLALIAGCAVISTLDLVFDRVLLRFKLIASAFFAITLFGCANVVIPALVPNVSAITTLLVGAGLSGATFMLFHLPLASLRRPLAAGAFVSLVAVFVLGAYYGRRTMPPVPMYVKDGGVGTGLRQDGTLDVEVVAVRSGTVKQLYCVTDVQVFGRGDSFRHVWRKERKVLEHTATDSPGSKERNVVRVASRLPELPDDPEGKYTVDVETASGQIVGRIVFEVKE
jgi:hypothetical protein